MLFIDDFGVVHIVSDNDEIRQIDAAIREQNGIDGSSRS